MLLIVKANVPLKFSKGVVYSIFYTVYIQNRICIYSLVINMILISLLNCDINSKVISAMFSNNTINFWNIRWRILHYHKYSWYLFIPIVRSYSNIKVVVYLIMDEETKSAVLVFNAMFRSSVVKTPKFYTSIHKNLLTSICYKVWKRWNICHTDLVWRYWLNVKSS